MKLLVLFITLFFLPLFCYSQSKVIKTEPLSLKERNFMNIIEKHNKNTKAIVQVKIDGVLQSDVYFAKSKPCQCNQNNPDVYTFINEQYEKVSLQITGSKVEFVINQFDESIPNDIALKINLR